MAPRKSPANLKPSASNRRSDSSSYIHGRAADLIRKFTTVAEARRLAGAALAEDIGSGDLSSCIFPPAARGRAYLVAKADGVLSGTALADAAFREAGGGVRVKWTAHDGDGVSAGETIATLEGPMATLLLGERVALNFLQQMSGVATLTRAFVDVADEGKHQPGIFDTRKTTPLLRAWQKKAVLDGGGRSHRFALYDMAMLKDNHIDAAGSIAAAVDMLEANGFFKRRPRAGLCIEVRNTVEALEATRCRADIILLDNMTPAEIRTAAAAVGDEAVRIGRGVPELEISGGITLKNLKKYADLPVQRISIGALTHSAPALDISMRYLK